MIDPEGFSKWWTDPLTKLTRGPVLSDCRAAYRAGQESRDAHIATLTAEQDEWKTIAQSYEGCLEGIALKKERAKVEALTAELDEARDQIASLQNGYDLAMAERLIDDSYLLMMRKGHPLSKGALSVMRARPGGGAGAGGFVVRPEKNRGPGVSSTGRAGVMKKRSWGW